MSIAGDFLICVAIFDVFVLMVLLIYLLSVIIAEIVRYFKRKRCYHICRFCKYREHCLNLSNKYNDEDKDLMDMLR